MGEFRPDLQELLLIQQKKKVKKWIFLSANNLSK